MQVLQYRGIPFKAKLQGLLNSSGINEGIVQGTNFKTTAFPVQYESALERSVRTGFTGMEAAPLFAPAFCLIVRLPRQPMEFDAWLGGISAPLPHRPRPQATAWR